jgi:hypothetical protein
MAVVAGLSGDESDRLFERTISMARAVEDQSVREGLFVAIGRILPEARRGSLLDEGLKLGSVQTRTAAGKAPEEMVLRERDPADPYQTLWLPHGRPFIDRQALRAGVRMLANPVGPNILIVNGPAGSGKSYTFSFIKHIADRTGYFEVVYVDWRRIPDPRPDDIVRYISVQMSIPFPDLEPTTSIDMHIRLLVSWLVEVALQTGLNWWWILDFPAEDLLRDTRMLVQRLAREVASRPLQVRLILLGFYESLDPEIEGRVYREELQNMGERDVRAFVADLFWQTNGDVDPDRVEEAMGRLRIVAPPNATLEALSAALMALRRTLDEEQFRRHDAETPATS